MNPLNFSGPLFLAFYLGVGLITTLLIYYKIKRQETPSRQPKLVLDNPYEIAILRAGDDEALRIAALSLVSRELLTTDGKFLTTKNPTALAHVRQDIERAILKKFLTAGKASGMFNDETLKGECFVYRRSLQDNDLVTTPAHLAARGKWIALGYVLLGGLAGAKILLAFWRGHFDVTFLVMMAIGFFAILRALQNKERTGLGDQVLEDLKSLFMGLYQRRHYIKTRGESNEPALLAAVFGIGALSTAQFPFLKTLFFKPSTESSSSWDLSSCGGGCGGGCGGCGS
ncbi:MAG: TIGR04222 domain-containing membrane protein [Candidatus Berkiella sp.]